MMWYAYASELVFSVDCVRVEYIDAQSVLGPQSLFGGGGRQARCHGA